MIFRIHGNEKNGQCFKNSRRIPSTVHVQSIGPWNILGHFFVVKFVFTTSKSLVHGSIRKTMTLNMAAMGGAQLEAVGTKLGAFEIPRSFES